MLAKPSPLSLRPAGTLLLALVLFGATHAQTVTPDLDVPYAPTPPEVVKSMLDRAQVNKNDTLYDLGCGDGRIVIPAAKKGGARVTGIDLNPVRIQEAIANAKEAGVEGKVNFMVGDLFKADFSRATVVTLRLLPDVSRKLRPQLRRQFQVGTRVVSHDFDMGRNGRRRRPCRRGIRRCTTGRSRRRTRRRCVRRSDGAVLAAGCLAAAWASLDSRFHGDDRRRRRGL